MGISGVLPSGTGISAAGYGGNSKGGSGDIQTKIDTLQRQLDEYEQQEKLMRDKSLDNKIESLERRISNLKSRLNKAESEDDECQTCKNRKYQDGSDDPGVSFKSATKVNPDAAASAVRGHEMEHVYRNQAKAAREDREVVSQSVRIKTAICPECGKPYVAGGETRTVTRAKQEDRFKVGMEDKNTAKGSLFDDVA